MELGRVDALTRSHVCANLSYILDIGNTTEVRSKQL
jgi:hypothetical protein